MSLSTKLDVDNSKGYGKDMETSLTLAKMFQYLTVAFNLQPHLLESVCFVETGHNASAYVADDKGTPSVGICQVKYATAKAMGFKGIERDLMRPDVNAYYAAKYLSYQIKRYHSNLARAVTAYNKGNSSGDGNTAYYRSVRQQMLLLENPLLNNNNYDSVYEPTRITQTTVNDR